MLETSNFNSGFLLQNNDLTFLSLKKKIFQVIADNDNLSRFDQYRNYFYKENKSASEYFISRIEKIIFSTKGNWILHYKFTKSGVYLIGTFVSEWDEIHFGYKVAKMTIFCMPNECEKKESELTLLLKTVRLYLKGIGVKVIISRINGDNITGLHAIENNGFRYYDNVIWPIKKNADNVKKIAIRHFREEDLSQIKKIAKNNQYKRGHFYCDEKFNEQIINELYLKWIDTTIKNKESIAVIEKKGNIAGFFVFKIDKELLEYTGYRYGRLQLLALDSQYRGEGLGEALFQETLSLIASMGGEFVDSGYSTKNHISAKLHTKSNFFSVYEEITFHLWLD